MDIKRSRILVTPTSYGSKDERLVSELERQASEVIYNETGRPLSSEELGQLLPEVDGYIAGLDMIDKSALASANRLKVISRYGVGVDNVDLETAAAKGIVVTNTPGANSASVAELTIALILSLARRLFEAFSATKAGGWPRLPGLSIEGKTIGLIGFGSIGKEVARRLCAFNCQIKVYDPYPDEAFLEKVGGELLQMEALLAQADFVSLHLPLLPETRRMVNPNFLSRMKPGSYLVNTSRGELIDEEALFEVLKSGKLCGAALDVFTKQPPGSDHPLLNMSQVLATPHCGAHTDGAVNAMGWLALQDCLAVLSGETPKYRVI